LAGLFDGNLAMSHETSHESRKLAYELGERAERVKELEKLLHDANRQLRLHGGSGGGGTQTQKLITARFKLAGQTAKSQRSALELDSMKQIEEMERRSAEEAREMNREVRKTLREQEKVLDSDLNAMEKEADMNLQTLKHMDALMFCLDEILPVPPLPKELRNAQCQVELDAVNPYEDDMARMKKNLLDMEEARRLLEERASRVQVADGGEEDQSVADLTASLQRLKFVNQDLRKKNTKVEEDMKVLATQGEEYLTTIQENRFQFKQKEEKLKQQLGESTRISSSEIASLKNQLREMGKQMAALNQGDDSGLQALLATAHEENEKLRDGWSMCRTALQEAHDELEAAQDHLVTVKRDKAGGAAGRAELERHMSGLHEGNADLVRRMQELEELVQEGKLEKSQLEAETERYQQQYAGVVETLQIEREANAELRLALGKEAPSPLQLSGDGPPRVEPLPPPPIKAPPLIQPPSLQHPVKVKNKGIQTDSVNATEKTKETAPRKRKEEGEVHHVSPTQGSAPKLGVREPSSKRKPRSVDLNDYREKGRIFAPKTLNRLIFGFYEEKEKADRSNPAEWETLAEFIMDFMMNKYGLLKLAESHLKDLVATTLANQEKYPRVKLFARSISAGACPDP